MNLINKNKIMTKEDLSKLIDECCDDIFDRKEPLANVKTRLYYTLKKQLTLTDVGCSLPSKEAMYFKELEEYIEEKEWDDRVNRRDFAKGFISCYKWITNQEFKVR
jgi:hypothetical protein